MLNKIIATFFVNELTASVLPPDGVDVNIYRQQLDAYAVSITSFIGQYNEAYEGVKERLIAYITKYAHVDKHAIIAEICRTVCPPHILQKLDESKKSALFRRFITESIKKMVVLTISMSNEILIQINSGQSDARAKYRQGLVPNFMDYLNDVKQDLYAEFSGGNNTEIRRVRTEQKISEELRAQNEELQFRILKLNEENRKLKQQLTFLQMNEKSEESEETDESVNSEFDNLDFSAGSKFSTDNSR
jgi:hypothetical protein